VRTVFSHPRAWLAVAAGVVAGAAAVSASVVATLLIAMPASAEAPSRQSVPISTTFPAPVLSRACGFAITGGLNGMTAVKEFVDREGNFSRKK
jgi:energy-converting hydrogenase Eha subunit A